jgi:hypothetical protein
MKGKLSIKWPEMVKNSNKGGRMGGGYHRQ